MRVFVAIVPPVDVVEELESFLEPRRAALAARGQWRWSRPEHLHLTLAFIPDLDPWREEPLIEAGRGWAQRRDPLSLALRGAGAFPDPGAARVLWGRVHEDGEAPGAGLAEWAKGVRAAVSHVGGRVDGTRFHPHLTLARSVGRPAPAGHLLQSLDLLTTVSWPVPEVVLIASYLGQGPRGTPRYEVRDRWRIGRGD